MQKDFHYAVIYILANWAGFSPAEAFTVAYSSQYVDDATNTGRIRFTNGASYTRTSSAHATLDLLNNANDIEDHNTWLPFHFLPGNDGYAKGKAPVMEFETFLTCTPNSFVACDMVKEAIRSSGRPNGMHRFGIAMHTYADTWAHRGFIGYVSARNKIRNIHRLTPDGAWVEVDRVENELINQVLPVGHGSAICNPDMPFLREWRFDCFDQRGEQTYENTSYFLEAADTIFRAMGLFQAYRKAPVPLEDELMTVLSGYSGLSTTQSGLLQQFFEEITSDDGNDRTKEWTARAAAGAISGINSIPDYQAKGEGSWKYLALGSTLEVDLPGTLFEYTPAFLSSDWKRFHDALQEQRQFILLTLLPEYEICVS